MTRPTAATLLALGLTLTVGCLVPTHVGEGDLGRALLPLGFEPVSVQVSAGEERILCEATGPEHYRLFFDAEMVPEQGGRYYWESFAFGETAKTGLALTPRGAVLLTVPKLCPVRSVGRPRGLVTEGSHMLPLPEGGGWVIVTPQRTLPNVWVVGDDPLRFENRGRSALPTAIGGAAVDDRTGLLVLVDETNRVEAFDIGTMSSLGVYDLPCEKVSGSVVAKDGFAWVGTGEGTVIPINVRTGSIGRPIHLGGFGDVKLALSVSSGILAAMVQDRSTKRIPYPTHLQVHIVGEGRLVKMATAFFETRGHLKDVAVLETTDLVVFACGPALLTWHYR